MLQQQDLPPVLIRKRAKMSQQARWVCCRAEAHSLNDSIEPRR